MKTFPRLVSAVIFDFDGTLAKLNIDFGLMKREVLALLGYYGINSDGLENLYILELIDQARHIISIDNPVDGLNFYLKAHETVRLLELAAAKDGSLLEGVRNMLKSLAHLGIKRGIITRNCRDAVMGVFPDVLQNCESLVTRESAPVVKPHPGHVLAALQAMEATVTDAVMVGDHPTDMMAGKAAGAYNIGVLTGNSKRNELLMAGADIVLNTSMEMMDIIKTKSLPS